MKTPLQQAKELHEELKKTNEVEALLRLSEFMAEYDGDDAVVPSSDLIEEIKALEAEPRYKTGITKLDEITDGFRGNQIVVLSAPPKSGKTQLCVHLARSLPNPTMFLFEESAPEVLYKYHKKGLELPKFYTMKQSEGMDVESLYRKMIEAWAKYNSKIFFIDHLHFILDGDGANKGDQIEKAIKELKRFCKRHNFTIFLVAHMTKGNFSEPPGVEAIRDSAHIPALADTVIIMWRETFCSGAKGHNNLINQTKNVLLNVALNRKINFTTDTNTGLVELTFNTDTWGYDESIWYTDFLEEDKGEEAKAEKIIKNLYGNNN